MSIGARRSWGRSVKRRLGGKASVTLGRLLQVLPCVILLLSVLVSCSPQRNGMNTVATSPDPDRALNPKPLELKETSYRWIPPRKPYPFNGAVDFVYLLSNSNSDHGVSRGKLRVTVRADDGSPVATEVFPLQPVPPGQTVVGGGQVFVDTEPATVQFEILAPSTSWVPASHWKPLGFKPLRVSGLTLSRIDGEPKEDMVGFQPGHSYFTGTVENPNSAAFAQHVIGVLHRDPTGKIVAHYSDIRGEIAGGANLGFRLDVPDKIPSDDIYEAYAQPWHGE